MAEIGPVTTTLIGAAGVVLGSAISTIPGTWIAHRRERRERSDQDRRTFGELRVASRLVVLELDSASRLLLATASTGRFWPTGELSTQAWLRHQATLGAGVSSPADWQKVTDAYYEVERLNGLIRERRGSIFTVESREKGEPVGVDDDTKSSWLAIEYAIGILQLLVDDNAAELSSVLARADQAWPAAPTSGA